MKTAEPLTITMPAEHEADELGLWLLGRCVFRDVGLPLPCNTSAASGGALAGLPVGASGLAFVDALRAQGFTVTTDGLCGGLLLKKDWKRHEAFQAAPEPSKPPARVTRAKRRWSW